MDFIFLIYSDSGFRFKTFTYNIHHIKNKANDLQLRNKFIIVINKFEQELKRRIFAKWT